MRVFPLLGMGKIRVDLSDLQILFSPKQEFDNRPGIAILSRINVIFSGFDSEIELQNAGRIE